MIRAETKRQTPEELFDGVIHPYRPDLTWDAWQALPADEREKIKKAATAKARQEYQRRYYQLHKEKAKEYQRQYNLKHKKKAQGGRGRKGPRAQRETVREVFNDDDIMGSVPGQTEKMLRKVVKGERGYTR
ncbi:MAG: hypothetical protein WC544_03050 [Patescibacteria group bacterium]